MQELERAPERRAVGRPCLLDAPARHERRHLELGLDLGGRLARLQAQRDGEHLANAAGHQRDEPRDGLALLAQREVRARGLLGVARHERVDQAPHLPLGGGCGGRLDLADAQARAAAVLEGELLQLAQEALLAVADGGEVVAEQTVKARELPRWVAAEAERLSLRLESGAAQALIAAVGDRQQRLLRELEKLALEHGSGARVGVDDVEAAAAPSAERQVWSLVDALVARDAEQAARAYLELRQQGEGVARLVPLMARRVREVLAIALRLEAGESPAQVKADLKMAPFVASRRVQEARATDSATLRRALELLHRLELDSRGDSELADETVALRAIAAIAA